MDESEWRVLAQLAIEELDGMPLDADSRSRLKEDLLAALVLPEGGAKSTIRNLLTSNQILRSWLDTKLDGDTLRSARGAPANEVQAKAVPEVDVVLGAPPGTSGRFPVFFDFNQHDVRIDEPLAGEISTGEENVQTDEQRHWLVLVDDYDESVGLTVGEQRAIHLAVGTDTSVATIAETFDDTFIENLGKTYPDTEVFDFTVQVASQDFDISGEVVQTLRMRRTGPSVAPVTWQVSPKHAGACILGATVHFERNFLAQIDLTLPASQPGPAALNVRARPPDSAASLERRDILLVMRPAPASGYDLTVGGSVAATARMPITSDELAFVVDDVQKALFKVVSTTNAKGEPVFQTGIDIPEDIAATALDTLARAGAYLYGQLFFHPDAGEDLKRVGRWLKNQATRPNVQLNVQVVAENAPVPWSMLYFGDTTENVQRDWNHFLGLHHVLDQIPLQRDLEVHDARIKSDPQLSVGLNVNSTIDEQFGVTWVRDHKTRWTKIAGQRRHLVLLPRSTRASVIAALDDSEAGDEIVYFLGHATSGGKDGNPGDATLDMGQGGPIVLRDLQSVVPLTRFSSNPLIFINACESADMTPKFYAGFVPYFLAKGARGVIGTECKVPVVLAVEFAERFFDRLLDGDPVGEGILSVRRQLLEEHRNPLGLMYTAHCDADTRVDPALLA